MALLTTEFVRDHLLNTLGRGIVNVELSEPQLKSVITSAVNLLNRYKPQHRWGLLPSQNDGRYYLSTETIAGLATTVVPGLQAVIDVTGVRQSFATAGERIDLFDPLVYLSGSTLSLGGLAAYVQSINHIRMARRVFSAEVEWRCQRVPVLVNSEYVQVFELFVSIPTTSRLVYGYEYLVHITADDSKTTGVSFIGSEMQDWFLRYCIAEAKTILGRALRKFQGIPSPDGADMQLDGLELATDGDTEKAELVTEIKSMSNTIGPIVG